MSNTPVDEPAEDSRWQSLKTLLLVLALLAIIGQAYSYQLHVFESGFYTVSADDSQRILDAARWTEDKWPPKASYWLPLHAVFTGVALEVDGDLFFTPRNLSNWLGLAVIAILSWLSWTLHRDRVSVAYTALLASFFAPRIVTSVAPTVEIMYSFFALISFASLRNWLETKRFVHVVIASIAMSLACGLRFEAWLLMVAMLPIIVHGSITMTRRSTAKTIGSIMLPAGILGVIPVAWLCIWFLQTGNPLAFLSISGGGYFEKINPDRDWSSLLEHATFSQFMKQNVDSLNIIGVCGLVAYFFRGSKERQWLAPVVSSFLLMSIVSLAGYGLPTHNFWRIPIVWSLALVPFTAHTVQALGRGAFAGTLVTAPVARFLIVLPLLWILVVSFHGQTETMTAHSSFFKSDLATARFLSNRFDTLPPQNQSVVFIERYEWHWLHVQVASQHPDRCIQGKISEVLTDGQPDLEKMRARNVTAIAMVPRKRMEFEAETEFYTTYTDRGWWLIVLRDP